MNTVLITLLAATFGFAETETSSRNATTPVSEGFAAALSDVSSEGPVADWISPRFGFSKRNRGSSADEPRLPFGVGVPGRNIIRGQGNDAPPYDSAPQSQSSSEAQTYVQGDPNQGMMNGPTLGQPYPAAPYDPFLGQGAGGYDPLATTAAPAGLAEYYDPYSRDFQFSILGPQPYRLGTVSNFEAGYIFPSDTNNNGVNGNFSVTESNNQWRNSWYMPSGVIFSWKPEFNYRGWSGPDSIPLPGHAYRFASDMEWGVQGPGPWGFQFGFTPQLATDFDRQINSDAWMFDGRGMLFFKPDPTLMLVGGVAYWDRVVDRFIPYAGVVWTPDEIWELRILYPKSRISAFLGDWGWGGVWIYGSAELNIEAYQIGLTTLNSGDQIELRDYRALIGLRSDNGFVSSFIEGGYVFDRHVEFKGKHPDFDISDGWMIRAGIRF